MEHLLYYTLLPEDKNILFSGLTLKAFMSKVEKLSELSLDIYSISDLKFKGMAFELLVEAIIKFYSGTNVIPLINYVPTESDNDWGIDGIGEIMLKNGNLKASVQCKYKADCSDLYYNADHLGNFLADSCINEIEFQYINKKHKDNIKSLPTLYIFTTGQLHYSVEKYFDKYLLLVKTYTYRDISLLIDNNVAFWKSLTI